MNEIVDRAALNLPEEIADWIGGAELRESSGASGAKTVYIDRGGGAYLKIAPHGALAKLAVMQRYFFEKGLSSEVLLYRSLDRDYLISAPLAGIDGTHRRHLDQPGRLCEVFGRSLRLLHQVNAADCPECGKMDAQLRCARTARFRQDHLDGIRRHIGGASAEGAAAEIARGARLLKSDALIHGDYCLPNILLDDWRLAGFIDVADAGIGDRHYDIAWGLWTLGWNLKTQAYGDLFLDAYGRDAVDPRRLRICGLLVGMD